MFDLPRITDETPIARIDYHEQIESTNSHALQIAGGVDGNFPLLVLTPRQTAGRGRGKNTWLSSDGALTFSLIVDPQEIGLSTDRWPLVSLTAAVSVHSLLVDLLKGQAANADACRNVGIKWPNDVLINGRKVCGILVETSTGSAQRLVVGVGLNVNNSFDDSAGPLDQAAIAVCELLPEPHSLTQSVIDLVTRMWSDLERLSVGTAEILDQWQDACVLTGHAISLIVESEHVRGVCRGIDAEGALVLECSDGLRKFRSGVAVRLEDPENFNQT